MAKIIKTEVSDAFVRLKIEREDKTTYTVDVSLHDHDVYLSFAFVDLTNVKQEALNTARISHSKSSW